MATFNVTNWQNGWFTVEVIQPVRGGAWMDNAGVQAVAAELGLDEVEALIAALKSSLQEAEQGG